MQFSFDNMFHPNLFLLDMHSGHSSMDHFLSYACVDLTHVLVTIWHWVAQKMQVFFGVLYFSLSSNQQ